jgi:hypothetical protein
MVATATGPGALWCAPAGYKRPQTMALSGRDVVRFAYEATNVGSMADKKISSTTKV